MPGLFLLKGMCVFISFEAPQSNFPMKKALLLLFVLSTCHTLFAQDITGQWNGLLKVQQTQLRIVFNINKNGNNYSATMDSPDQGAKDIPVSSVSFENNELKITAEKMKLEYNGTLQDGAFNGNFKQGNFSIPMNLTREEVKVEKPNRPQEPKPPYSYYTEEVIIKNSKNALALSGTLSMPSKDGKFPVVILISGSGPQNRDEELMGHKPFLVIADFLTKNGFAVLRYDDRGVANSTGNFKTATSADFAEDVESALVFLKNRKEIDKKKIGLIGHSEGGFIAPLVASRNKEVAFIVSLAGPGIPCDELLVLQGALISKASGMQQDEIEKNKKINSGAYEIVKKATSNEQLQKSLTVYFNQKLTDKNGSEKESFVQQEVEQLSSPWMEYFIKYNPVPALEKVHCPVLALNGSNDLHVPPKENLDAIKKALTKAGNKKVTIKTLPNLNHLFQECKTGLPSEYAEIEQTFSPTALNEILNWLKTQTK